jgi:prepilin-type N-terminal cleavage/methylation domain-containing protein/prepilin-type processing-associated H-X9-DG protein
MIRPRGAFTLIELLVVISIVALLVSILLPALAKARQSAMAIKCGTQLKQVGLGFNLYAEDHKDSFPVAYDRNLPTPPRYMAEWYREMVCQFDYLGRRFNPYAGAPYFNSKAVLTNPTLSYATGLLGCPSAEFLSEYINTPAAAHNPYYAQGGGYTAAGTNYGLNWRAWTVRQNPNLYYIDPLGRQEMIRPSSTFMLSETQQGTTNGWAANMIPYAGGIDTLEYRHLGSLNMLYMDGHVVSGGTQLIQPDGAYISPTSIEWRGW